MKPLNVLCCSTRQWNPGDEWIALGIRNLFKRLFTACAVNWILYDRSPDCFERPWESSTRRERLAGDSSPPRNDFVPADLVIAAGTPEWIGPYFKSLLDLQFASQVPWLFLGIDHGYSTLKLTPVEFAVLSRALVIVRGELAHHALRTVGVNSFMLPCPSLFASDWEHPCRQLRSIGVVIQRDHVINQSIFTDLKGRMTDLVTGLAARYEVQIVCNYIDEFLEFSAILPGRVLYSYDSSDYIGILSRCDAVVATRLDSAFLANSMCKPAIVINSSPRISSAAALYPYAILSSPEAVLENLKRIHVDSFVRRLLNWKRLTEELYLKIMSGWLMDHGFDLI